MFIVWGTPPPWWKQSLKWCSQKGPLDSPKNWRWCLRTAQRRCNLSRAIVPPFCVTPAVHGTLVELLFATFIHLRFPIKYFLRLSTLIKISNPNNLLKTVKDVKAMPQPSVQKGKWHSFVQWQPRPFIAKQDKQTECRCGISAAVTDLVLIQNEYVALFLRTSITRR